MLYHIPHDRAAKGFVASGVVPAMQAEISGQTVERCAERQSAKRRAGPGQ